MADAWEKAAKLASEKRLGEAAARKIISDMLESVTGEGLPTSSTRDFLNRWVESRKADTSPRTHEAYAQIVREFLASLGGRGDLDISQISTSDVSRYRDKVLARTSVATANKHLKYLRIALGAAWKAGFAQDNPAAKLDTLKRPAADHNERRPFTLAEVRRILKHADGEWRGIVLFGLYSGQRLGDIARLTWANVDTENNELAFTTIKTGRRMQIPLAAPLLSHLETLDAGDDPDAPLFPSACAAASVPGGVLSQQFHGILAAAGLVKPRLNKQSTGKGRASRRDTSEISFHSLRHSAVSLLKNAGVPELVVRDIIGHDSEAVSRRYSHVDPGAKRKAVRKLVDITKGLK